MQNRTKREEPLKQIRVVPTIRSTEPLPSYGERDGANVIDEKY